MLLLAIYHCSIKIFSRGKGQSAVAAVAYRAAEKIQNNYDGKIHDFTKKGGVVYTEIMLPDHAPAEYADRTILWNAVEKVEKAKNSQLAREIELALPVELTLEQNKVLVRDYVNQHFVSVGMCADFALHDKKDGNPHAHIMLTMRPINMDGTWGDKQRKEYTLDKHGEKIYDPKKRQYKCKSIPTTDWNDQTKAEVWREAWANAVNAALEKQNLEVRVDHRSYERQGIEQIPTIHLGAAAHQMEQKGIVTDRGNRNREIGFINRQIEKLKEQIHKLKDWLKRELLTPTPDAEKVPTAEEQIKEILSGQGEIQERMKEIDGRINVLDEHLRQVAIRRKNYPYYKHYRTRYAYEIAELGDDFLAKVEQYKSASVYLKPLRNAEKKIPTNAWERERKRLLAERERLSDSRIPLSEQLREIERIRKSAEMATPQPKHRNQDWTIGR